VSDHEEDEDWREAMWKLRYAFREGYDRAEAIDDLITIRLAIMIEQMAERLEKNKDDEPKGGDPNTPD
jgi:hypothetical protein